MHKILSYREWLAQAPLWLVSSLSCTEQRRQVEYKKYILAAQAKVLNELKKAERSKV